MRVSGLLFSCLGEGVGFRTWGVGTESVGGAQNLSPLATKVLGPHFQILDVPHPQSVWNPLSLPLLLRLSPELVELSILGTGVAGCAMRSRLF